MLGEAATHPDGKDSVRPRTRAQRAAAALGRGATHPASGRTPLQGPMLNELRQSTARDRLRRQKNKPAEAEDPYSS